MVTKCTSCQVLIKLTEKYLIRNKFKNNIHYVDCNWVNYKKLTRINGCAIYVLSGIVDNNSYIMELPHKIHRG